MAQENNNELSQEEEYEESPEIEVNAIRKVQGTKEEVFQGIAQRTAGGLHKEDLIQNKKGKIVSKKKAEQGQKAFENIKNYHNRRKEEKAKQQQIENNSINQEEEPAEQEEEKKIEDVASILKQEAPKVIPSDQLSTGNEPGLQQARLNLAKRRGNKK